MSKINYAYRMLSKSLYEGRRRNYAHYVPHVIYDLNETKADSKLPVNGLEIIIGEENERTKDKR